MSDPASELDKLRAELAQARAVVSTSEAMISGLKLEIALLRRETYGHSAERTARLIDQLELQLEDLVTDAAEDAIRAEKTTKVAAFDRKKPVSKAAAASQRSRSFPCGSPDYQAADLAAPFSDRHQSEHRLDVERSDDPATPAALHPAVASVSSGLSQQILHHDIVQHHRKPTPMAFWT